MISFLQKVRPEQSQEGGAELWAAEEDRPAFREGEQRGPVYR